MADVEDEQKRRHQIDPMPIPDEQDAVTVAPPDGRHLEENPAAQDPLLNPQAEKS